VNLLEIIGVVVAMFALIGLAAFVGVAIGLKLGDRW
jgi:hypothetical protein